MKKLIVILFFLIFFSGLKAQEEDTLDITFGIIEGNDTIIHKELEAVDIFPDREFASKRQQRRYSRLVEKVKKVYPLALEAAELLEEYEPKYNALEKQSDRRKMMKNLEKELLAKHKDELKKWSISDGRILLKLIDRETERTAYSLIQDFRGDVSAVFWQGIALIFKNNLKDDYDPEEEDWMIEEIVTLIERGYL
ncbi:MAG: DUF4294 domain-containing protein [Prolixibacteraceae bacterium]|nr:DUF4294 domain-containing protein [Prolixibacteraceae bacterium]